MIFVTISRLSVGGVSLILAEACKIASIFSPKESKRSCTRSVC